MKESPPEGENVSSDSSEESDSDMGTPGCHRSDSISWAEEGKDGQELAEESTEEFMEEPNEELVEEPAEVLAEGPDEELAEEPAEELAGEPAEETTVERLILE